MDSLFRVLDELCSEPGKREPLEGILTLENPEAGIMALLGSLGEKYHCDRAFVFETVTGNVVRNTYEWCGQGVSPQKDLLQNETGIMLEKWFRMFEDVGYVIIKDLEEIRESHSEMYACLKTQDIQSLLVVPLFMGGRIGGFWGVDNPGDCQSQSLFSTLSVLGRLIVALIERREARQELEYRSSHDLMTGCFSRDALFDPAREGMDKSRGLVYCDVTDLKRVNREQGRAAGDELLAYWCGVLRKLFEGYDIFRLGGDEFLVVCPEIGREEMQERLSSLKLYVERDQSHLAVGYAWSEDRGETLSMCISRAEANMYEAKEEYYSQLTLLWDRGRERRKSRILPICNPNHKSSFRSYIRSNYFEPESFFASVSQKGFYPFMGDLKTKIFYISDEMRIRFGFSSNWVPGLVSEWEKRIWDEEDLEVFRQDIRAVLNRDGQHELCYRVRDAQGDDVWVISRGRVVWDEAEAVPVFVSGGIYLQDPALAIDDVTNLPRESGAILKIGEIWDRREPVTLIGLGLNHFSEINEIRNRYRADFLLREIVSCLKTTFEGRLRFYRMDGLRFVALLHPGIQEDAEGLARQIRQIVKDIYYSNSIAVRVPCSAGILCMEDPRQYFGQRPVHPRELLGDVIGLIDLARSRPEEEFVVHSTQTLSLQRSHAQMLVRVGEDIQNNFDHFRIVLQPVVHTGVGRVTSAEVLLRWQLGREDVSTELLVDILEKNRMIVPVGRWVCEQVVRSLRRVTAYQPDFRLACNVSYYQIMDRDFIPFLRDCLEKYEVRGESLILEITETHYDESPALLQQFIEDCRRLGIGIAMDDFGNGYASLAFLLKYQVDIVKLDRNLLEGIEDSGDHMNFLSSIVYACHKFGCLVCIEGVEREREAALVKGTGCDMIQGFYYYRPMEADEFFAMLSQEERYLPGTESVL